MTKEEIIELAEMAGLIERPGGKMSKALREFEQEHFDMLIAFAKLIAEKERAKFCNILRQFHDTISLASDSNAIRARGNND